MVQEWLPNIPGGENQVNGVISVHERDGNYYYFVYDQPVFFHPVSDHAGFRMFTAQLCCTGMAKQVEIIRAFGVTAISVKRSVKKYREEGIKGFYSKRKTRGRKKVMTDEVVLEAEQLFAEGFTRREVSDELGISYETICKTIQLGRMVGPEEKKE